MQDLVIVVSHQTIGVTAESELRDNRLERVEKDVSIDVVEEDQLSSIAACQNMKEDSRHSKTQGARHAMTVPRSPGLLQPRRQPV